MNHPGILVNRRKSEWKEKYETRGGFEEYVLLTGSNNCHLDRRGKHREGGERKKERRGEHEGSREEEMPSRDSGLLSRPNVTLHLISEIRPSSRTRRGRVCKFNLIRDLYPSTQFVPPIDSWFVARAPFTESELPIRMCHGERVRSGQMIEILPVLDFAS